MKLVTQILAEPLAYVCPIGCQVYGFQVFHFVICLSLASKLACFRHWSFDPPSDRPVAKNYMGQEEGAHSFAATRNRTILGWSLPLAIDVNTRAVPPEQIYCVGRRRDESQGG